MQPNLAKDVGVLALNGLRVELGAADLQQALGGMCDDVDRVQPGTTFQRVGDLAETVATVIEVHDVGTRWQGATQDVLVGQAAIDEIDFVPRRPLGWCGRSQRIDDVGRGLVGEVMPCVDRRGLGRRMMSVSIARSVRTHRVRIRVARISCNRPGSVRSMGG
ncbi:hypothetical protein GCM10009304_39020 [Pseudomonas matsuisoli]|uniref:Uncharacterized protein n=1 Tax=Pseudomonas matsuisoli TaxID=1515666 RepID=A0A917Q375_9PSED|nr:hypothetical protein GCM10009304_39020 [Pseudomonas matsuisoli]